MPKFTITSRETAEKVLKWHAEGRGLKVWKSHDLGAGRPDMLTPGDAEKPHWAYCSFEEVTPADVEFDERTTVELPPEWFDKCGKCEGSGVRTYQELAEVRKESVEETKQKCTHVTPVDSDHFVCTYCHGKKYDIQQFKVRVKREYWGAVVPTSSTRINAMLKKLGKHYDRKDIQWELGYTEENAMAEVRFYYSTPVALSESELVKE